MLNMETKNQLVLNIFICNKKLKCIFNIKLETEQRFVCFT